MIFFDHVIVIYRISDICLVQLLKCSKCRVLKLRNVNSTFIQYRNYSYICYCLCIILLNAAIF